MSSSHYDFPPNKFTTIPSMGRDSLEEARGWLGSAPLSETVADSGLPPNEHELACLTRLALHELQRDSLPLLYLGHATDWFVSRESLFNETDRRPLWGSEERTAATRDRRNETLTLLALTYASLGRPMEAADVMGLFGAFDRTYDNGAMAASEAARIETERLIRYSCGTATPSMRSWVPAVQRENSVKTPEQYLASVAPTRIDLLRKDAAQIVQEGPRRVFHMLGPMSETQGLTEMQIIALAADMIARAVPEGSPERTYFNAGDFRPL